MAIIRLPLPIAANTDVIPNIKTMTVTDNEAALTAAGFLNAGNLQGYTVSGSDVIQVKYNWNEQTEQGDDLLVNVVVSNGIITLVADFSEGNVELPVTADHLAVYVNAAGKIGDDAAVAINAGDIQAGVDGTAGTLTSLPAVTNSGKLVLEATANAGNFVANITNEVMSQSSTFHLVDPEAANGYVQVSSKESDPSSNLIYVTVDFSFTTLAGGATVTAYTSGATSQYRIREVYLPYLGSGDFSGGGGDRDIILTDGASTFTILSAATLGAVANARWGDASVPYPSDPDGGINANTVVGANLEVKYSGGTTDYTAGNLALIFLLDRVT